MQSFDIPVIRSSSRSLIISVQANNLTEAQYLALDQAGNHEFPGEKEVHYSVDDSSRLDRSIITIASKPFFSGDVQSPWEEYQKLLDANNNGEQDSFAYDCVNVSEPYENFFVNELLSTINDHIESIRGIVHLTS